MFPDHYRILGLKPGATPDEIGRAYRRLAQLCHPDHNRGDKSCEKRFKQVKAAYEVLIAPDQRREYDAARARAAAESVPDGTIGSPSASPLAAGPAPPVRAVRRWAIILAFIICGAVFALVSFQDFVRGVRSYLWPAATARITDARAIQVTQRERRYSRTFFVPRLTIHFDAGGRPADAFVFPRDREAGGHNWDDRANRDEIESLTRRDHPVSSELTIVYDPEDPKTVQTKPGPEPHTWCEMVAGIVELLIGSFLFFGNSDPVWQLVEPRRLGVGMALIAAGIFLHPGLVLPGGSLGIYHFLLLNPFFWAAAGVFPIRKTRQQMENWLEE